ncbi:enoyl-CoA hydratase/isomerase family protein [Patulibacter defluvii]|uniref:enoyl-CoA hydratase/isomerase family protein n=1 Tax=Patulibacter defluvii TaxID=3095358 RepID=UPI002A753A5B|nr:enoyl-CoA hydratase/isomerase family protein [Patulibacter sp. DM4]
MSPSVTCGWRPGPVAELTLRRPDRHNAVDERLVEDLHAALDEAAAGGAAALVLVGEGRSFCSGHDVGAPAMDPAATRHHVERLQDVSRVLRAGVPSVAAVRGYALGAGFELALSCDLVVAAEDARFGLPEVPMGLAIGGGASALLVRALGAVRARELVLLGGRIEARRALELGLVNEVRPADEVAARALELATRLAGQPATALATAKRLLGAVDAEELEAAYVRETEAMLASAGSDEAQAAAHAYAAARRSGEESSR